MYVLHLGLIFKTIEDNLKLVSPLMRTREIWLPPGYNDLHVSLLPSTFLIYMYPLFFEAWNKCIHVSINFLTTFCTLMKVKSLKSINFYYLRPTHKYLQLNWFYDSDEEGKHTFENLVN